MPIDLWCHGSNGVCYRPLLTGGCVTGLLASRPFEGEKGGFGEMMRRLLVDFNNEHIIGDGDSDYDNNTTTVQLPLLLQK